MKQLGFNVRFFVVTGVLNLAVGVMFYIVTYQPPVALVATYNIAAPTPRLTVVAATTGVPIRVVVPSLKIDLPVGVGSYDPASGDWTLSDASAYYADASLPVNDSNGRTLIYGHARAAVFAKLINLPPQATAEVYTDNGHVFRYRYQSAEQVTPDNTSIFSADGPPTLVLQTCTGAWSAYRSLYSFKLESVEKV